MKKDIKEFNYPLSIFTFACIVYAVSTFFLNIFLSLKGVALEVWANLLIFALILIVSSIIVLVKKIAIKSFIPKSIAIIYTILSTALNVSLAIVAELNMWHWTTVILLAAYSLIITILLKYLRLNSYLLRSFINYLISIFSFFLLTNVIGRYKAGDLNILFFGIFTLTYIVMSIVFFYVKRSFLQIENEEQDYKKQFD